MKSLSRALTVLTELSRQGHPSTLSDISNSVGLHKSTVHRMLATFVEHGLVRRDEANRYVVGLAALELARAAQGEVAPDGTVEQALAALHEATGQTATYALPRGGHMAYAAVVGLAGPLATVIDGADASEATGSLATVGGVGTAGAAKATTAHLVGSRVPLHSTALGKAYLAHRPRVEVDRYIARTALAATTPHTITDEFGLLRALARTRSGGYAVEDREYNAAVRQVGAPVLDRDGLAIAAVAVTAPPNRSHPADLRWLAAAAVACADRISAGILGCGPSGAAVVPAVAPSIHRKGA